MFYARLRGKLKEERREALFSLNTKSHFLFKGHAVLKNRYHCTVTLLHFVRIVV